jgi:hypothetical protein
MLDVRQQMTNHIDSLSGEQVKSLVLSWLSETGGTLSDFESLLDLKSDDQSIAIEFGQLNDLGEFQPLTENEQIQKSLETFAEYRLNRNGISHDRVSHWLESIGTDRELPCPQ